MYKIAAAMSSVSYSSINNNNNNGHGNNTPQRLVQRTHMATPLATYNKKLERLDRNNNNEQFWEVIKELDEKGIKPDVITWNMMINRRSAEGEWDGAYKLLGEMRAAGYKPTVSTYNNMLRNNIRHYHYKINEKIMENMERDNIPLGSSFYDMIINGRSRLEPEHALRTLKEMKARGMLPLASTYISLMRSFGYQGDSNTVMQLLRDAERHVAVPVYGYFHAFESCTDSDNLEGALYCWNYFMRSGINVHEGGCLALLRLAANAGDGSLAGDVLRHLTQQKYKSIVGALVNSDDMAAFGVLDLMEKANIPISQDFVAAWTNRLATSKAMLDKGFGLLERIHKEGGEQGGRKIHTALFNGLLIASLRLRDPERVASYFEQVTKLNVVPNTDSYNALLDACKIAQQPTMAVDLLAEMRENNIPLRRVIAAFCGVPAGESYEEAFQYLEETKSAGYVPTESMYVMIIRKCARERDPRANIAMEEMETIGYTVGHNLRRYVEAGGIAELLNTPSNDRKNTAGRSGQHNRLEGNNNEGNRRRRQQGYVDYSNRTHGELADS
ncbi:hypothetical protein BDF22DRAFT_663092 [Syncephalis plumigaleata]|nr:hypothetical protein BDF22DRAFT_663092 [Syncephalis plumigaleata]